jgi:hypothetical protein
VEQQCSRRNLPTHGELRAVVLFKTLRLDLFFWFVHSDVMAGCVYPFLFSFCIYITARSVAFFYLSMISGFEMAKDFR